MNVKFDVNLTELIKKITGSISTMILIMKSHTENAKSWTTAEQEISSLYVMNYFNVKLMVPTLEKSLFLGK